MNWKSANMGLIAVSMFGLGITLKDVSAEIGWWIFVIALFAALITRPSKAGATLRR